MVLELSLIQSHFLRREISICALCCSYSQSLQFSFLVPPGTHPQQFSKCPFTEASFNVSQTKKLAVCCMRLYFVKVTSTKCNHAVFAFRHAVWSCWYAVVSSRLQDASQPGACHIATAGESAHFNDTGSE